MIQQNLQTAFERTQKPYSHKEYLEGRAGD